MKIRVVDWPRKTSISTLKEVVKTKGKFLIPGDSGYHPEIINIPQLKEKDFQEFSEEMAKLGYSIEKV
jgi:hypothetical protein